MTARVIVVATGQLGRPGPAGGVDSVNGETGAVVLDADDVNAEAVGVAAGLVDALTAVVNNLDATDIGADPAGTAAVAIGAHATDTTNIHGINDTSLLLTGPLSGNPLEFYNGDGGFTVPAGSGAVVADLDDLTDVTITSPASGDIIRHDGAAWVDAVGTSFFETAGAVTTHTSDTTAVHGITDTSLLETTSGATSKVAAHAVAADPHGDRAYTDAQIAAATATAFDFKASVRAATTGNITLSGAQTIDGVSVVATNRVLVKDQTTGSQNGIYVASAGAWARATDADISAEVVAGMAVPVDEGTAGAGTVFILTTPNPITLATTALTFNPLTSGGDLLAANNGSDFTSPSQVRTNLGLAIGTDVQAYSAVLAATTASFLTADETKLDGIEAAATADMTATEILTAIKTVDGAGSGLDADLLDGLSSAAFEVAGAAAAAQAAAIAASQPVDSDLTALAATTNTPYGRSLLGLADAPALRIAGGLVIDTDVTAKTTFDAHLADTTDAHDASAISVLDTAGAYTATDAEGVFAELPSRFAGSTATINAQTGTTYTFVLTDENNEVTANNASPQTYTVPANSSVPFTIGRGFGLTCLGAGDVTITPAVGVTFVPTGNKTLTEPGQYASFEKIGANTWSVLVLGVAIAGYLPLAANGASVEDIGTIEYRVSTIAATGATEALDTSLYAVFDATMDQACTFSFTNPAPVGKFTRFRLILRGAFTPTWPDNLSWPDDTAPTHTTASTWDFETSDAGQTWFGRLIGKGFIRHITPTNISNLGLWLDASDATSFTFSSGTLVSQWNDKSGNNRHMTQATVTNQPSRSATINSLSAVDFDGVDNWMGAGDAGDMLTNGRSTFAVVKFDTVPTTGQGRTIIGKTKVSPAGGTYVLYLDFSGTALLRTNYTAPNSTLVQATSTAFSNTTTPTLLGYILNRSAGTLDQRIDRATNGTTTFTADTNITWNTSYGLYLGGLRNNADTGFQANYWLDGKVCELISYEKALSTQERDDLELYLKNKWGTA